MRKGSGLSNYQKNLTRVFRCFGVSLLVWNWVWVSLGGTSIQDGWDIRQKALLCLI